MCAQLVQRGSIEAAAVANEARRRNKQAARASRSAKGAVSSVLRRLRSRASVAEAGGASPAGEELSHHLSGLSIAETPDQVDHAARNPGERDEQSHSIDLSRVVADAQRPYAVDSDDFDIESGCDSPLSSSCSSQLSYLTAHSCSTNSTSGSFSAGIYTPRSGTGSSSSTPRGVLRYAAPISEGTGKPRSSLTRSI